MSARVILGLHQIDDCGKCYVGLDVVKEEVRGRWLNRVGEEACHVHVCKFELPGALVVVTEVTKDTIFDFSGEETALEVRYDGSDLLHTCNVLIVVLVSTTVRGIVRWNLWRRVSGPFIWWEASCGSLDGRFVVTLYLLNLRKMHWR